MKGDATRLVYCMQGTHFVIPVYQRKYDWRLDNCRQLFQDLVKTITGNRETHFFGSIVSAHCEGEYNKFLVIDGQQRVTTISLLMLAMYNMIQSGAVTPKNEKLADQILNVYLLDPYCRPEDGWKLKLTKEDQPAYERLFQAEEAPIPGSNLTINYQFFCDQIKKEQIGIDDLFEAITRLEIINITLSHGDNAQLIFESLNSTGRALSEGDKIRNYILMGMTDREQTHCYDTCWSKIEHCTDPGNHSRDVSAFVRDYLSVKQQAIPSISQVYTTFKSYAETAAQTMESLLQDLLAYARRYQILLQGNTKDRQLNACIYRLNRLETTVTRPFFLEVLRMQDEGILTLTQVREIFLFTENYLFRRVICELPTNALNKIFVMLHREIMRFDGSSKDYAEKFKYALLSKNDRVRFPRDEEFTANLSNRQIYLMNSKNKIYILERLENFGTVEDKAVYQHCDDATYSIEHIMPQHLTAIWAAALGPDYEIIHEQWLHRLANLTLTGYNSKYSNNSFKDKRDCKNGFRDSGLRMNIWVGQQECWTLSELQQRNDLLMQKALEIWPIPQTNYQPEEKQLDCYTLEDEVDLSGRDIVRFEYQNVSQPVVSWLQMQMAVLKMLHESDKSVLAALVQIPDNGVECYISNNPAKLRKALYLDEDIFLERNTNTSTKIAVLRKCFQAYGVNPQDLVFYLRDPDEEREEAERGTRYELRRKYWAFALEYIHKAHAEKGTFTYVNPSKENWITGAIGISGFSISCVANYDQARVELVLTKPDKERNKAAFEYLKARKSLIEQKLGTSLEWLRSDDTKASYVTYRLPGVGIDNETDWIQMAKFHAEWSKKFYDVFVPLLLDWNET